MEFEFHAIFLRTFVIPLLLILVMVTVLFLIAKIWTHGARRDQENKDRHN